MNVIGNLFDKLEKLKDDPEPKKKLGKIQALS